ncbi:hypothetical protein PCASD_22141 [Puccinia coronata f. sp. avenae]|uniref:Uncharacterized protein n=1 Tax=Puccinia coronata f. sp. avenae TaxID=200324 RepID=A0A2N5TNX6_9BASI|nr:hypothetical protein PCASD_22141 [Puccinia coronata f. sp. avenae]
MLVQANAFAHRVTTTTGAELAVDISKEREDIKHNAISITRRLEETHYTNNPYAEGGEKYGFDPRLGRVGETTLEVAQTKAADEVETTTGTLTIAVRAHASGNQSDYYNAQPEYKNNSSGYNNNRGGQSGSGTSGRGKKPSRGGEKPAV